MEEGKNCIKRGEEEDGRKCMRYAIWGLICAWSKDDISIVCSEDKISIVSMCRRKKWD